MVSADRRIQDVGVTHLAEAETVVCLRNVGHARQPGGGLANRLEINVSAVAVPPV